MWAIRDSRRGVNAGFKTSPTNGPLKTSPPSAARLVGTCRLLSVRRNRPHPPRLVAPSIGRLAAPAHPGAPPPHLGSLFRGLRSPLQGAPKLTTLPLSSTRRATRRRRRARCSAHRPRRGCRPPPPRPPPSPCPPPPRPRPPRPRNRRRRRRARGPSAPRRRAPRRRAPRRRRPRRRPPRPRRRRRPRAPAAATPVAGSTRRHSRARACGPKVRWSAAECAYVCERRLPELGSVRR